MGQGRRTRAKKDEAKEDKKGPRRTKKDVPNDYFFNRKERKTRPSFTTKDYVGELSISGRDGRKSCTLSEPFSHQFLPFHQSSTCFK